MTGKSLHPAQRFAAPSAIKRGEPLKNVISVALVKLIAESFVNVMPRFDVRRFVKRASVGLADLELKERGAHIGAALAEELPADFDDAATLIIASLGPELAETENNGLATFFYFPHSFLIAERGINAFKSGMLANYELTKRFSAEFSIRPFVLQHEKSALSLLRKWTKDPNPHVRRLVSEGTRPRLPWALRLRNVQQDPSLTLPLLELLKDDRERYVQRSVANHLADILKDHPKVGYATMDRWTDEVEGSRVAPERRAARHWIIRHAVRLPAKRGFPRAMQLREACRRQPIN